MISPQIGSQIILLNTKISFEHVIQGCRCVDPFFGRFLWPKTCLLTLIFSWFLLSGLEKTLFLITSMQLTHSTLLQVLQRNTSEENIIIIIIRSYELTNYHKNQILVGQCILINLLQIRSLSNTITGQNKRIMVCRHYIRQVVNC